MPGLEARLARLLAASDTGPAGVQEPTTARRYLDRAYELAFADDERGAILAAEKGLAAAGSESELRVRILGVLTAIHANSGAEVKALEMLAMRLAELRGSGREAQADVESRLGLLLFRQASAEELPRLAAELSRAKADGAPTVVVADLCLAVAVLHEESGRPDTALPLLRAAVDYYRLDGHTDGVSGSLLYLAHCLAAQGSSLEAMGVADELLSMDINRALKSAALLLRARLRAEGTAEPKATPAAAGAVAEAAAEAAADAMSIAAAEAADDAADALELYLRAGIRTGAIAACTLLAQLLIGLGRFREAAMALRLGVEQAERAEHPSVAVLKMNLGNALVDAEDYLAAAEVLAEADRLQERADVPDHERAALLASLGHARRHSGQHAAALGAWRTARRLFSRAGQHSEASRILLAMGALLSQNHRGQEALDAYAAAEAEARLAPDDPDVHAEALHALGYALCEARNKDGLVRLQEAIELTRGSARPWLEADITDTLARGLWILEQGDAAIAAALGAADLFGAAGDGVSAGSAEFFAARVLAQLGRQEDAVAIFRSALDHTADHTVLAIGIYRGLADALDALNRPREAEAARSEARRLESLPGR